MPSKITDLEIDKLAARIMRGDSISDVLLDCWRRAYSLGYLAGATDSISRERNREHDMGQ